MRKEWKLKLIIIIKSQKLLWMKCIRVLLNSGIKKFRFFFFCFQLHFYWNYIIVILNIFINKCHHYNWPKGETETMSDVIDLSIEKHTFIRLPILVYVFFFYLNLLFPFILNHMFHSFRFLMDVWLVELCLRNNYGICKWIQIISYRI